MTKYIKFILVGFLLATSFSYGGALKNANKGKKVFMQHYKRKCGFNGMVLAHKHTRKEWKKLYKNKKKFKKEIKRICPKVKRVKGGRSLKRLYQFNYYFARDSGKVPSC